jgi:hypothetical protein
VPHVPHEPAARRRDDAELALPNWPFGFRELIVVEQVEHFHPQLGRHVAELGVLDHRHVGVPLPRPAHRVAAGVAERARGVGTCWKHAVLNHLSIVAPLNTGSQIVFGRLFVRPVDSMLCDCVIWIGSPERMKRMPLTCHPP